MTSPALSPTHEDHISIRTFRESDYSEVARLFRQHDLEFIGSTNFTEQFLRDDWNLAGFNPITDVGVAGLPDGTLAAFLACYAIRPIPSRPVIFGYAVPEYRDALAPHVIAWGIERGHQVLTRVPEDIRVVLEANVNSHDAVWQDALVAAGFAPHHQMFTMLIRFGDQRLIEPALPPGFRIVSFADHPHIPTWAQTVKASFADHRGSADDIPLSYYIERYERDTSAADFDASAWWIVMDGDTPSTICTTYEESDEFPNVAYVHQLGTVPQYRRRGLALSLLHHTFREFQQRGKDGVSLGVDGASLTNAVALYQRAGMHIAIQWNRFELELRPGIEITKQ